MSTYSDVTEQSLNNIRKLAEQQKNQRALRIKNRVSRQTYNKKLAESVPTITKNIEEINKSTN